MRTLFNLFAGMLLVLLIAPASAQGPVPIVVPVVLNWDSNTTVANTTITLMKYNWASGGTINSVSAVTQGSSTPSFTAEIEIGSSPTSGTGVTGCTSISVTTTEADTSCTAANVLANGNYILVVISSVSGVPNQALIQLNMSTGLN
jgi:hypothetical protein